ncbi:unnamed protein product, partial [Candidula unifasciata]
HGARGLQGKKPGRHKFSVIFGVGNKKYRTSVIKEPSGNPDWNEESVVHIVSASDHVFFTVMEKEDVLGHISIPVASLVSVKEVVKATLRAHKKCPNPQGELIFQCYVSKERPAMLSPQTITNTGGHLSGFQKLRQNFSSSQTTLQKPNKEEKEEKRKSSSLANFNRKLSKSIHDIFHIGRLGGSNIEQQEEEQPAVKGKKFNLRFPSMGTGLDSTGRDVPVVTHIVPNMASTTGGTRLVLEGRSLGLGKSDIMELILCGSDLLDSIEFESENRIYVTTKPTAAGKGDLWIETVSGGQNVIKNIFTFVDRSASSTPLVDKKNIDTVVGRNSPLTENRTDKTLTPGNDSSAAEKKTCVVPTINIERSASLNKEDRQRKVTISGSATLPLMKTSGVLDMGSSSSLDTAPENNRKSYQKHTRGKSESVVGVNKDAAEKKSSEKAELQAEILRLHRENQGLKQENADMKSYIDGLVARVMIHCPEALAAGDDLKPLPSGK